jgi:predicted SprT family Zn-dependent metalloprotease
MKTEDAELMAKELFEKHGLQRWRFSFDSSKRRFGVCRWSRGEIQLSRRLVELNDEPKVRDTLLHEIAHALCPRGAHHGPEWYAKAVEIGCDGNRCYKTDDVVLPTSPWVGTCPGGHEFPRYKMPRGERKYSCNKCSPGKFNSAFLISYKRR